MWICRIKPSTIFNALLKWTLWLNAYTLISVIVKVLLVFFCFFFFISYHVHCLEFVIVRVWLIVYLWNFLFLYWSNSIRLSNNSQIKWKKLLLHERWIKYLRKGKRNQKTKVKCNLNAVLSQKIKIKQSALRIQNFKKGQRNEKLEAQYSIPRRLLCCCNAREKDHNTRKANNVFHGQ